MAAIDSSEAIRELQVYLRTIARYQGKNPLLQATGDYDGLTRKAVEEFQRENSLPVTGTVDIDTWEAITRAYQETIAAHAVPVPLDLFPSDSFLLGKGSSGNLVKGMQLILQALSRRYHNIPQTPETGLFDDRTESAVRVIQEKSNLETTGIIDLPTWNRIAWLYNFSSKVIFDSQVHEQ